MDHSNSFDESDLRQLMLIIDISAWNFEMNFCRHHRKTYSLKLLHHIVELSDNTVLDLSLEKLTTSMKIFAVFQPIYSHLLNRTNKLERKMHDDTLQHFLVNSQTAHIAFSTD